MTQSSFYTDPPNVSNELTPGGRGFIPAPSSFYKPGTNTQPTDGNTQAPSSFYPGDHEAEI